MNWLELFQTGAFCSVKKHKKNLPQTNNKAHFLKIFINLNLRRYHITACVQGKRLTYFAVGDSLSTPVCRKSVCHRHTHLLLLWKVLFSCWVDICLTAMHICHLMEWTKLNLDRPLSFGIVLRDESVCYGWNRHRSICRDYKYKYPWLGITNLQSGQGGHNIQQPLLYLSEWALCLSAGLHCWLITGPPVTHCIIHICSSANQSRWSR